MKKCLSVFLLIFFALTNASAQYSPNATRYENYTWYDNECLQKNDLVCATFQPLQDGFAFGEDGDSFWLVPPYIVWLFLVAIRTKNEGTMAFAAFLPLVVLSAFIPTSFSFFIMIVIGVFGTMVVKEGAT